jgi:hypothetical protein
VPPVSAKFFRCTRNNESLLSHNTGSYDTDHFPREGLTHFFDGHVDKAGCLKIDCVFECVRGDPPNITFDRCPRFVVQNPEQYGRIRDVAVILSLRLRGFAEPHYSPISPMNHLKVSSRAERLHTNCPSGVSSMTLPVLNNLPSSKTE